MSGTPPPVDLMSAAEDHVRLVILGGIRLHRKGLERMLLEDPRVLVVGTAPAGAEALELVCAHAPDAALLDLSSRAGMRLVGALLNVAGCLPVVGLSTSESEREVIEAAEAGVSALVAVEADLDTLVATVQGAIRGEMLCSPRVAAILRRRVAALAKTRHDAATEVRLTSREDDVMALIEAGRSNREIAEELCIEVSTVKNHLHNVYEKMHVRRRAEAVAVLHTIRARPVLVPSDRAT
jgi:two-component system, NarL family, nitrate/nitrite response regulator NarL